MILNEQIIWGSGSDSLTLAAFGDAVSEMRVVPLRGSEDIKLIRSQSGRTEDRGGNLTEITVTVVRQHASALAARLFLAQHARTFQRLPYGTSRTLHTFYRAAGIDYRFEVPACTLTALPGRQKGATTFHDYTARGGALT